MLIIVDSYTLLFLIVVDPFWKWIDMIPSSSATSDETIEKLRIVFGDFRLPEQIVTDNGSAFTSKEFETFIQRDGIQQIRTAPYHSALNGQAWRTVQHSRLHWIKC